MFVKHSSLLKAEAVVSLVMRDQDLACNNTYISIASYQNGREQGLTLCAGYGMMIYVAENRNSDNIIVYIGKDGMQGLSDDAYKNSQLFRYDNVTEAADYIREELKKMIRINHTLVKL